MERSHDRKENSGYRSNGGNGRECHQEDKYVSTSFGDARYAPIAAEDQGRVIAAILNNPVEHAGKIYPLYGPKELTQYEVADILTRVLGRRITYAAVEIDAFMEIWKKMGFSFYNHQHIAAVAQDCRDGVFSGTNDLVEKFTGQKPLEMVDYIIKNKALFI